MNRANTEQRIVVAVVHGEALELNADVLAVKFAQSLYGAELDVVDRLLDKGINLLEGLPKLGQFLLIDSLGVAQAKKILFVGVEPIASFSYPQIRQFGRRIVEILKAEAVPARHVLTTIHGPGYGLDEVEAFESQLAGLIEVFGTSKVPDSLERITIVERNPSRAQRLSQVLARLLPSGEVIVAAANGGGANGETLAQKLGQVGYASAEKPRAFVAMPFAEEMEDVFHYGIQGAVNSAGFLCERADLSSFTGDVMTWVKSRIETASLVVADLSGANPNVYLEVGYAWACGRSTVLLVKDSAELKFDTRGQRCLVYKNIKDLEQKLGNELKALGNTANH
jgi:hypothetical protein